MKTERVLQKKTKINDEDYLYSVRSLVQVFGKYGISNSCSKIQGGVIYLYVQVSDRNKKQLKTKKKGDSGTEVFDFIWPIFLAEDSKKRKPMEPIPDKQRFVEYVRKAILEEKEEWENLADAVATLISYDGIGRAQLYHVDMLWPLVQVGKICVPISIFRKFTMPEYQRKRRKTKKKFILAIFETFVY